MLFSFVLWLTPAWMFMRKLRREEATGVESSGDVASQLWVSSETAEEAMRNELRLMLIGSIAVVALCWLDFGIAMTSSIKPLRLHPLGILLLSSLGGIIVGRRAILSELQVRELETLLKAREAAADDVAHEMKTPLTVIKGYALTLLRMSPEEIDSSLLQDSLTAIADEAERLTRMINNMLDIARLEAGKPVTLRVQDVNLKTMLLQLIERMQRLTDKHNLKLQWHASREEFTIDADKVYQVVLNLVDNAIKYSPSGGDVIVKVEEEEDLLRISVIDQGIGMTKEQQERLFRRLERVVDPKRKIMGTGIGLYLMKKLVEAMGGEMGVQSEPQKGSTFWFTIPKVMKH
jgi:signal transduction histidine kinase